MVGTAQGAPLPTLRFLNAPLLERGLDLGDPGENAGLVLFAAGSSRGTGSPNHLVADLDRNAAADRDRVRNLLQIRIGRIRGELHEFKRGLAAGARGVSLQARELHGVGIGAV